MLKIKSRDILNWGEGIGEKHAVRAGCKEGIVCKDMTLSSAILLLPLSQPPRTTVARCRKVRSVCPTPSHGKWPSSSVDALTAVLPSSLHTGCCLQPTAKPGIKAEFRGLGGHGGKGLRI